MRRNHLILVLASIFAVIPFLILSFRVGTQLYRNQQSINHFSYNGETEQYQNKVPMNQMNLSEYSRFLEVPQIVVGTKVQNTMVLPIDIQYFTEQNGKKSVVEEIRKGTGVLWIPTEQLGNLYLGYGLRTYPTYDKGWRYGKPFLVSGEQTDVKQLPYYYVKTADLEVIAKQAINSTEHLANSVKSHGITIDEAVFVYTRFIDTIFYDNGVFCSPDLQRQVWHLLDTLLLSIAVVITLVTLLLKRIL